MWHKFEIYPNIEKNEREKFPFFIEFKQWDKDSPETWQLFRRQFLMSKEEWIENSKKYGFDNLDERTNFMFNCREVHPWNLGEGIVNDNENVIDMNTPTFLRKIVDALNAYEK